MPLYFELERAKHAKYPKALLPRVTDRVDRGAEPMEANLNGWRVTPFCFFDNVSLWLSRGACGRASDSEDLHAADAGE